MTEPIDKPKKPRGFAAMAPEKAAAIRAKSQLTKARAKEIGDISRRNMAAKKKYAGELLTALEALYGLAKESGVSESHPVMRKASAALYLVRCEN